MGTGNDLARVLGWGSAADEAANLPQLLEKFERSYTKMLDRWSILMYEGETQDQKQRNSVKNLVFFFNFEEKFLLFFRI